MFGRTFLWFGLLVAALQKVEAGEATDNIIKGESFQLSHVLNEELLVPYNNQCQAIVLNGGFLTLENDTGRNYTLNYPNIFITCEDGNENESSLILKNFASILSSPSIDYDLEKLVGRDSFEDSILMIAFASCAVCIGTWMVYLVLMLLPSESRLSRSLLVSFYVLFSAFYDTVMLVKTVEKIFKDQYRNNVQDFCAYDHSIISRTAFRVGGIIGNLLVYANWTMIIYYMYHDKRKITMGWIRPLFSSRNKLIIVLGTVLTIVDTVIYATITQHGTAPLRIVLSVLDFLIYALFCGLTYFFVWHDFRFTLAPQRMHSNQGSQVRDTFLLIWNDYHETIPLLIYSIALFALLFFTKIFFTIDYSKDHRWKFKIVRFIQLIITVSVWGLIGVLEKRELILSKQTVLGRKISDNDEYFFDPKLSSRRRNTADDEDRNVLRSSNTDIPDGHDGDPQTGPSVRKPTKVWRSQMMRPKNLRNLGRSSGKRFLDALIGFNDDDIPADKDLNAEPLRPSGDIQNATARYSTESNASDNIGFSVQSVHDIESANGEERASVETQLARNYIYEYDNNH